MTLREIDALFKNPSVLPEKRTAEDINLEVLKLILDLEIKTVTIKGINESDFVKGTTNRKYATFENTNGIGFTFDILDDKGWDGSFELTLLDRPNNVTAIDEALVKRKFNASNISALLQQKKLSTYTDEHR